MRRFPSCKQTTETVGVLRFLETTETVGVLRFLAVVSVRDFCSSLLKNTKTTGTEKGIYAMYQRFIFSVHSKVRLDNNNIEKSIY